MHVCGNLGIKTGGFWNFSREIFGVGLCLILVRRDFFFFFFFGELLFLVDGPIDIPTTTNDAWAGVVWFSGIVGFGCVHCFLVATSIVSARHSCMLSVWVLCHSSLGRNIPVSLDCAVTHIEVLRVR